MRQGTVLLSHMMGNTLSYSGVLLCSVNILSKVKNIFDALSKILRQYNGKSIGLQPSDMEAAVHVDYFTR